MKHLRVILISGLFMSVFACGSNDGGEKEQEGISADSTLSDTLPVDTGAAKPHHMDSLAPATGVNAVATPEVEKNIRASLQKMFEKDLEKDLIPGNSRKFVYDTHDLNSDGTKEVFVGLNGPYFCGSGGCNIILFNADMEVITTFTVSSSPVVIADSKTNGWKDLMIYSNGKNHLVKFGGKKYPSNPSLQPVVQSVPSGALPKVLGAEGAQLPGFDF